MFLIALPFNRQKNRLFVKGLHVDGCALQSGLFLLQQSCAVNRQRSTVVFVMVMVTVSG
jgi:hypothetical protein